MRDDNDTLIALVSSLLLPRQQISPEEVLDALVHCDGNVSAAVGYLNSKRPTRKRKHLDLASWLQSSPHKYGRLDQITTAECPESSTAVETAVGADTPTKLETMLRQRLPIGRKATRPPAPRLLATPSLVSRNTPCTLHLSILPPELACELFYTMIDHSKGWKRNTWWLFDRLVESPHLTSFYARRQTGPTDESWGEAAQHWYNGRITDRPQAFPDAMERACQIIEKTVNEEMNNRKRYPLEWAGNGTHDSTWRANVAASNCYQGSRESVGFHSDQLTYLGPYPTIASLSLGTTRHFSLREVIPATEREFRKAQTFDIPLPHNSLTIMHASCQERFKHSIPPQPVIDLFRPAFPKVENQGVEAFSARINITFRFYRPDFRPATIPLCDCGVPTILRPDMKNRVDGTTDRYWWTCYAGAQNDGKGCKFWKVMNMEKEGRGPCVGMKENSTPHQSE